MGEENLGSLSIGAFVVVMLLLAALASAVGLLTRLFPAPTAPATASAPEAVDAIDSATVAATAAAVASLVPGHHVTRIERDRR